MMHDRVSAKQRLEIAKSIWLTIQIAGIYIATAMLGIFIIFVLLKLIGVI